MVAKVQLFLVTAYCHCVLCTPGHFITKSGVRPIQNITVACPSLMLGLFVRIEGWGVGRCEDIGPAITEGRLDIYMTNHDLAQRWGRQKRRAQFYSWLLTPVWDGAIIGVEVDPKQRARIRRDINKKRGKPQ